MKKLIYSVASAALILSTSCSDFLERAPQDALSPSTFWQTESDAYLAMVGCYNGLDNIYHDGHWTGMNCLMMDALSDDCFDYFSWEGYQVTVTGNINSNNNGVAGSWFRFDDIRACNEYIQMEGNVAWPDEATQKQYLAEVKTLRAMLYQFRSQLFGDYPLVTTIFETPGDAYVERNSASEVYDFVKKELTEAINSLPNKADQAQGRINKQFAQGLLMRQYLWEGNYASAETLAKDIINNGGLTLASNYDDMWLEANQYDSETIFDYSFISNTSRDFYGDPFVPNGALGGWSSVVPTVDLVESFECIDGKPITESPLYDPKHPYENRDPRLRSTVLYSGQYYPGYEGKNPQGVYNSLPRYFSDGTANPDWWNFTGNATKTGLNLKKYLRYENVPSTGSAHMTVHYKAMRLAEVILSLAECYIEQNKNLDEAADLINQVRTRAYANNVYGVAAPLIAVSDQETMREQVRRERRMELGTEGLRRFDLRRWGIFVEKMNNFTVAHYDGDLTNEKNAYGDYIAEVTGITDGESANCPVTNDGFKNLKDYQKWWPISQGTIDNTPSLKQTAGY